MANLAERARTAHRRQIVAAAGESVTFTTGGESVTVAGAIRNEVVYEIEGSDGMITQVNSIDWFLPQDQLVINSRSVEPKANDQLKDTDGVRYEPMRPGPEMPAVTSHCRDEFWLVHSKKWKEA